VISGILHLYWIGIVDVGLFYFTLSKSITMGSFIQSGKYTCPAGRTDRCRHKSIFKIHPLLGQPIHLRCLDDFISGISQSIPTLVIGKDKDDVGLFLSMEEGGKLEGQKKENRM